MVVVLGSLLVPLLPLVPPAALWFVPLLMLVIRPLAVLLGALDMRPGQRALTAWFGIRGVGSIYYLMYALTHGVAGPLAEELTALTIMTIAVSIIVHGISVTPLMGRYRSLASRREARRSARREA
jgi:NhaP-type Na+/H+ or K+/H+ antiporter